MNDKVNISAMVIFLTGESIFVKNLILYTVEMRCKILPPWGVIVKMSLIAGTEKYKSIQSQYWRH